MMNGTPLAQSPDVLKLPEIEMEDDEIERLKKVRADLASVGYKICRNVSELRKLLGHEFRLVHCASGKTEHHGRLEKMEQIAHDLCQRKTG